MTDVSWKALRPHIPTPILNGSMTTIDMRTLTQRSLWCISNDEEMWAPGQASLCGFFIPPFQRESVWTATQQRAFVESAYLGITLGTIVYNDAFNSNETSGMKTYHRTDRWLIDGQQRLTALTAYVDEGLAIFLDSPYEHRWDDLNDVERRTFWSFQMSVATTRTTDEDKLRTVYNRLNYGGVAHRDEERAEIARPVPLAA